MPTLPLCVPQYGDYKAAGNQAPGWGYTEGFKYIAETKVPKEAGFSWNYAVSWRAAQACMISRAAPHAAALQRPSV